MAEADDLDQVIEQYHQALDEILEGSADGYKRSYSHTDDVTLANPFGPTARGWDEVAKTLSVPHRSSGMEKLLASSL